MPRLVSATYPSYAICPFGTPAFILAITKSRASESFCRPRGVSNAAANSSAVWKLVLIDWYAGVPPSAFARFCRLRPVDSYTETI